MVLPRARLPLLLIALAGLAACESEDEALPTVQMDVPFRQDGLLAFAGPGGEALATVAVEIVETPADRQRGLMFRRSMTDQMSMLFIMDREEEQTFTMKNTYVPLDIIFVGADSAVVDVAERTRPLDQLVTSQAPAKYVVEVRAGFADRHGITNGTRIAWRRDD